MSLTHKNSQKKTKIVKTVPFKDRTYNNPISKFQRSNTNGNIIPSTTPSATITITTLSPSIDPSINKDIEKLQDELIESKKLLSIYEDKIKELTEKIEKKNSIRFLPIEDQKLATAIQSSYDVLIEIIELVLIQPKNQKDYSSNKQQENISCSMDIYDTSSIINNDEDRRAVVFEQIQQILLFKLNSLNKLFKLGLDKQIEKVKNWNFNFLNTSTNNISNITSNKDNKENISNISNLSYLSNLRNKIQQQNNNNSMSSCKFIKKYF